MCRAEAEAAKKKLEMAREAIYAHEEGDDSLLKALDATFSVRLSTHVHAHALVFFLSFALIFFFSCSRFLSLIFGTFEHKFTRSFSLLHTCVHTLWTEQTRQIFGTFVQQIHTHILFFFPLSPPCIYIYTYIHISYKCTHTHTRAHTHHYLPA